MSAIEWTEQTWNPVTGCTKVSPGCKHCYAETMARRLQAMGAPGYDNGFGLSLLPERLGQPLKRRRPTMYFVNSMSDLFQEGVPDSFIDQVMNVIAATPRHTYQILTKRSDNMRRYFSSRPVPGNAWLGVSVEDRKYGKPRIPDLRSIDTNVRFLSVEPLLEALGTLDLSGIHWVIVGGESGAGARPMKEEWALSIRNQCLEAGVDFFFKQWGAWGADGKQRNKKANGRVLDGRVWDRIPAVAL
ncbi:MAG: phage Gp37/Gp68 family protein [Pseudohongiellaceae bacterium]